METQTVADLLDAEAISRAEALGLHARYVVEGYMSGEHKSPYRGFAVEFAQPWFVLERVHLAHPTLHEKENAALGLTRKMGAAGGEGAVRRAGPEVIDRHATKRHGTDAIPSTRKKLPSI